MSGGSDFYVVGHFTKDVFVIDSFERKLTYSVVNYAAQSFSGIEDGRVIRLWWNKNRPKFLDYRFSQQMSIPIEMGLSRVEDKYYLSALPVSEISTLYDKEYLVENHTLNQPVRFDMGAAPLDISLSLPYVSDACVTLEAFGAKIKLDTERNTVMFDKLKMPISLLGDKIDLRVIVDRCSVEIYADGGRFCLAEWHISDFNLPYVKLSGSAGITINKFSCHTLDSIHKKDEVIE